VYGSKACDASVKIANSEIFDYRKVISVEKLISINYQQFFLIFYQVRTK